MGPCFLLLPKTRQALSTYQLPIFAIVIFSSGEKNLQRSISNDQNQRENSGNHRASSEYRARQQQRGNWRGRNDGRGDFQRG